MPKASIIWPYPNCSDPVMVTVPHSHYNLKANNDAEGRIYQIINENYKLLNLC